MGLHERFYYRDDNQINLSPSWNQRSAVSTLIIINVAIFVANILFSQQKFGSGDLGNINEFLLLSSSDLYQPIYWWRVLSYGFVHDTLNIFHLVFNMVGLYFLGRSVEDRYGRSEFYRIYLGAIVICGIAWLLKQWMFGVPNARVLGASGAVIFIEMLFVLNFPMARIILIVFPVPAWVLGILLVLTNMSTSTSTGIAYDVHLVGILLAFLYFFSGVSFQSTDAFFASWRRLLRRWTGPKLRIHNEQLDSDFETSRDESIEADRILAKIHERGQESLTSKERKFLERYSRTVRAKKQDH